MEGSLVPVISMFYGIIIKMHFRDHNPPHFHAEYQGFEAYFDINSGEIIKGEFPPKARNIVKDWTMENQDALLENWKNAQSDEPLFKIPGADQ
jgi:hypothetical protein